MCIIGKMLRHPIQIFSAMLIGDGERRVENTTEVTNAREVELKRVARRDVKRVRMKAAHQPIAEMDHTGPFAAI